MVAVSTVHQCLMVHPALVCIARARHCTWSWVCGHNSCLPSLTELLENPSNGVCNGLIQLCLWLLAEPVQAARCIATALLVVAASCLVSEGYHRALSIVQTVSSSCQGQGDRLLLSLLELLGSALADKLVLGVW